MYFSFLKQRKNSNFSYLLFKYRLKFKMQKHIQVKLWGVFKAFMCIQTIEKKKEHLETGQIAPSSGKSVYFKHEIFSM